MCRRAAAYSKVYIYRFRRGNLLARYAVVLQSILYNVYSNWLLYYASNIIKSKGKQVNEKYKLEVR